MQNIQELPLDAIKTDGGTQTRVVVNGGRVDEYAESMAEGAAFPLVTVFHDGSTYWLADGFHRWLAAKKNGAATIGADVKPGGRADALLYALAANATHGLPRTAADKRNCVQIVLMNPDWGQWVDQEIADRCKVCRRFVGVVRRELEAAGEIDRPATKLTRDADGNEIEVYVRPVEEPLPGGIDPTPDDGSDEYEYPASHIDGADEEDEAAQAAAVPASEPGFPVSASPPVKKPAADKPLVDGIGLLVPKRLEPVFRDTLDGFDDLHEDFRALGRKLDALATSAGGEVLRRNLKLFVRDGRDHFRSTDLHNALTVLENAKPFAADCPECQAAHPGKYRDGCKACHGLGWITEAAWERVPKERKAPLLAQAKAAKEGAAS